MQPDDNQPNQTSKNNEAAADPAVNVIRQKIDDLYAHEPDTDEEMVDAVEAGRHRSKHQKFMYELTASGKSLAEIQTAWHNYYTSLPEEEKHQVWQEFYSQHGKTPHLAQPPQPQTKVREEPKADHIHKTKHQRKSDPRSVADVKDQLFTKLVGRGKLSRKQHLQSLLFGLGMASIVTLILLLGFFNERFIAPFITPSRNVSSTAIIVDQNATAASSDPKIIIPKINVEVPVVYDEPSIDERAVQKALERGVVHYAITPQPGEKGNAVIVGHSSNNIFNQGKYKFAFVLLNRLENGDTFMVDKGGKRYVYKVYEKRIVKPTDVSVIAATAKPATITLITCDPPGTSINRLIVVAEQVTPDPTQNVASTALDAENKPAIVPGNAQSLWKRFTTWLSS